MILLIHFVALQSDLFHIFILVVSIYNVDRKKSEPHRPENDSDSPQLSPSSETYEALSALSHACQLINAIAFYLHINLPFRLHQL